MILSGRNCKRTINLVSDTDNIDKAPEAGLLSGIAVASAISRPVAPFRQTRQLPCV